MSASAEFEGDAVTDMVAKLPAMTVALEEGYTRGTVLRLQVEVRVKSVRLEENRQGDLERHHVFALEDISLVSSFDPAADRSAVTGSASATPPQDKEAAAELGLEIGRTAETWGQGAKVKVTDEGVIDPVTGEMLSAREPVGVDF